MEIAEEISIRSKVAKKNVKKPKHSPIFACMPKSWDHQLPVTVSASIRADETCCFRFILHVSLSLGARSSAEAGS